MVAVHNDSTKTEKRVVAKRSYTFKTSKQEQKQNIKQQNT